MFSVYQKWKSYFAITFSSFSLTQEVLSGSIVGFLNRKAFRDKQDNGKESKEKETKLIMSRTSE